MPPRTPDRWLSAVAQNVARLTAVERATFLRSLIDQLRGDGGNSAAVTRDSNRMFKIKTGSRAASTLPHADVRDWMNCLLADLAEVPQTSRAEAIEMARAELERMAVAFGDIAPRQQLGLVVRRPRGRPRMSEHTRKFRVLDLLRSRAATISEIVDAVGEKDGEPAANRQAIRDTLSALRRARLIESVRRGCWTAIRKEEDV